MSTELVHPVNEDNLLSPELAFKSVNSDRKKKKKRFDHLKKNLYKNQILAYDENLNNLDINEEPPVSPLENRKIKKTGSPSPKSPEKSPKKSKKSWVRLLYLALTNTVSSTSKSFWVLFIKQFSSGSPYVYIGIALSFICELYAKFPKYNLSLLLATAAATQYEGFNEKSIRPQVVIFMLMFVSSILDIQAIALQPMQIELIVMIVYIIVAKIIATYRFLMNGKGTKRARKYLSRRFRVFMPTNIIPRRLLRDIRARILAIEWIQFFLLITYVACFILSITTFEFYFSNVTPSSPVKVSISLYLMGKCITSAIIFFGLIIDTNIILCLAYFGCMGFCMKRFKEYIRKKRDEYGGWPLAFAYNRYRFYVIAVLKFCDWVWGLVGWVILGSMLGKDLNVLNDALKAAVSVIILLLIVSDLWIPLLILNNLWLIKKHNKLENSDETDDSDDSELDDFQVRTPLTSPKANKSKIDRGKQQKTTSKKPSQEEEEEYDDDDDESESSSDISSHREEEQKNAKNKNKNKIITPSKQSANYLRNLKDDSTYSPMAKNKDLYNIDDIELNFSNEDSSDYIQDVSNSMDSKRVIIDPYATVSAEEFGDMWTVLSTAGEFSCFVRPIEKYTSEFKANHHGFFNLVDHLRNTGFYIIAASEPSAVSDHKSESPDPYKLYAYAVGYSSRAEELTPVYFLIELVLNITDVDSCTSTITCTNKCTKKDYTASFVEELNLGCLFQLLGRVEEWMHTNS